jgi:hypothetical protein
MKQTLKIAVPVVVLMAVIFGVTFFAQYTPNTDDKTGPGGPSGEPPLRFFSSTRMWDPRPEASLQNQNFPGFYERQANAAGQQNGASFWFENRNTRPVTMKLKGVSCTSCSGGRVAAIPPQVARQILDMSGVSVLPGGLFSAFPVGMAGPAANLAEHRLTWQSHTFRDEPNAEYKIPAATDDPSLPQWGILELRFSVGAIGPKKLEADFEVQVEGNPEVQAAKFDIAYLGVEPFDLSRLSIEVGDLTATSNPANYDVILFSATRGPRGNGPGDLAPPAVSVEMPPGTVGEPGPFVSVGAPVRLPEEELPLATAQIDRRGVRLEAAYRMTVTVAPRVGDKRIDLGPLERDIHVSTADTRKTIRVRGTVRGDIWLDGSLKDFALPTYNSADGVSRSFTVVTKQPAAELVQVPEPATPDFLKVVIEKLPSDGDRGYHRVKVTVPPGKGPGGAWNGLIALELKGPQPQRIRIPVRGNATQ